MFLPQKKMITVILILSLCFQTISSSGKTWDLHNPLIVNKNGNEVFFPRFVEDENESHSSSGETKILYKEPGDITTQTYGFCKDPPDFTALKGTLLESNPKLVCLISGLGLNRSVLVNRDGNKIRCGGKIQNSSGYYAYSMFSNLKIDQTEYKLGLYYYCYDEITTKTMLYGFYDLDNPSLLGNTHLTEEQNYNFIMLQLRDPVTETMLDGTDDHVSIRYGKQTVYEAFEVAISAFVPYGYWMMSFYQWHNVAPIHKRLTLTWANFVDNIRWELAATSQPLKVYSGVYDELKVNDSVQYLADSKTPIPMFWWILLYNKDVTQGVSLIMHNYSYSDEEKKHDPLCQESVCDNVGLQGAIPRGSDHRQAFIYCCPASAIAQKFGFKKVNELLKFTDEDYLVPRAMMQLKRLLVRANYKK